MTSRVPGPWSVEDNSGGITGGGWRLVGPSGIRVFPDDRQSEVIGWADRLNTAYAQGVADERARCVGLFEEALSFQIDQRARNVLDEILRRLGEEP